MVWSSYMKFWQQFKIHKLFVCAKFQGNESCNFRFRTRKLPQKFGVKSGLIQNRLKYGQKYFTWLYVVRYPFIPTYTFSRIEFFFFFCFLNFVHSFFLTKQHRYLIFCVNLLSCKCKFYLLKFFEASAPEHPPKWGPKKLFFLVAQAGVIVFCLYQ